MRTTIKSVLASCLAIWTITFIGVANTYAADPVQTSFSEPPAVGKPAPNFQAPDLNNQSRSLAGFKGKYVVLEWVNFDCPFTAKHYSSGNMQKLQKEYTGKGVIWLSINSSAAGRQGNFSTAQVAEMIQKRQAAPSYYLLDSNGQIGRLYAAKTTPQMFVINPQGILIYSGAIDDKPTADVADIATATNFVKAALDEALSGKAVKIAATKSYGCSIKY